MLTAQQPYRRVINPYALAAKYRQPVSFVVALSCLAFALIEPPRIAADSLAWHLFDISGLVLVIFATFGRIWSSFYIRGYKDDRIVSDGPYSLVRNPLYFFSFWGTIGIGMTTKSWPVMLTLAFFFVLYYPLVVKAEEQFLRAKFGQPFLEYLQQVPRFIPLHRQPREPKTYVARPLYLRKSLQESLWFFWFYIALHLLTSLQGHG